MTQVSFKHLQDLLTRADAELHVFQDPVQCFWTAVAIFSDGLENSTVRSEEGASIDEALVKLCETLSEKIK